MKLYNTYKDQWGDYFGYKMFSLFPYIIIRNYINSVDINIGIFIWYLHFNIKK